MKKKADKKFITPTQGPPPTLGIFEDLDEDLDNLFANDEGLDLEITKLKNQVNQIDGTGGTLPFFNAVLCKNSEPTTYKIYGEELL